MADTSGDMAEKSSNTSNEKIEVIVETSNGESYQNEEKDDNSVVAVSNSKDSLIKTSTMNNFCLRSSLLGSPSLGDLSSPSKKGFMLNPSRLPNPFSKSDKDEDKSNETVEIITSKSKEDQEIGAGSKLSLSFMPLKPEATTSTSNTFAISSTPPTLGFVFGQNIHEKVENTVMTDTSKVEVAETNSTASLSSSEQSNSSEITSNGTTSEMLFSVNVKKDTTEKLSDRNKSLSEAAREYEEARAVKRKFDEVPVLTGEEEEANVLQINCKLFSWSSSWTERGRGTLRVNDLPTSPPSHRLIVRTTGSLRVVLNTKIWSGMTIDRASIKSMRLTAMDNNGIVKIFLVMASPKEMDQLQKCLEWRVNNLKKLEEGSAKKVKVAEDS